MWEYLQIVEIFVDAACKYNARVELTNGEETQAVFFKFQSAPDEAEIESLAVAKCDLLNNPPVIEEGGPL